MNDWGVLVAIFGAVVSSAIILFVLVYWIERLIEAWEDRWVWIRKILVRKIIFRSKYRGTDSIFDLNEDIETINHIFFKYDLYCPYDKDEKTFLKEYKNSVTQVTEN